MRRRHSSPAPAPPLEDEDLLQEILLRLPPQPSSLPRASLVCKRWRLILSDRGFLKRFRKHHRKPPLLGFFVQEWARSPVFTPVLDRPDRIPAKRFPVPQWDFMGCRHGLAILVSEWHREIMVWDPLTGQQHRVNFPLGLDSTSMYCKAAVMCVDAEDGHVHGDCFSALLKLFLIFRRETHAFACVYESGSGAWGDIISVPTMEVINPIRPSILVGNALYWLLSGGVILVHNFESQSLGVVEKLADVDAELSNYSYQLLRTKNSGLGLAVLSKLTIQIWVRKSNCDGVVGWMLLQEVTPLEGIFPRGMSSDQKRVLLAGYDEDTNVIVLTTWIGNFMLQVDSMQIRNIPKANDLIYTRFSPYTNFYTAGRGVGRKGADLELRTH